MHDELVQRPVICLNSQGLVQGPVKICQNTIDERYIVLECISVTLLQPKTGAKTGMVLNFHKKTDASAPDSDDKPTAT